MTDKKDEQFQTAIRIPGSWVPRLDKLAERMSQPGMNINRAEVIRVALHNGIEALEAKHGRRR